MVIQKFVRLLLVSLITFNSQNDMLHKESFSSVVPITGCDNDFLKKIDYHIQSLSDYLSKNGIILDGSINQLKTIDYFLSQDYNRRTIKEKILLDGLIAYGGEIIRKRVNGQWSLEVNEYESNKYRFFPIIIGENNKKYYFSPVLEDSFNNSKHFDMHHVIQVQLLGSVLPVEKMDDSWLFPPIEQ